MSFLGGWFKSSTENSNSNVSGNAEASAAASTARLVDPDEFDSNSTQTINNTNQNSGGFFSGMSSFMKGVLGSDTTQVKPEAQGNRVETYARSQVSQEQKNRLWTQAAQFIGTDPISLLSLPVWVFEPTSILQRMAEPYAFAQFLYKAADAPDQIEKLSWIATWIISMLSVTERTGKPFNPILGETFEYVSKDYDFKFIAEQVSHHPPIGVSLTTSEKWSCKQEGAIKTIFHGNSIDIFACGTTHVYFHKTGDHFYWKQANCCAHNLIGGVWIDYWGDVIVENDGPNSKGEKIVLKFHKSDWFGDDRARVSGEILDEEGKVRMLLIGKWNEFLAAKRVDKNGKQSDEEFYLWQTENWKGDPKYGLPPFTQHLNEIVPEHEAILPETDSRLRGDRRALEAGDLDLAGREKTRLEEKQRKERRERESGGTTWTPRLFRKNPDSKFEYIWEYIGNYWEEKQQRIANKH
eukprot:TRINITY_DN2083_c2_g1_i1.p1 TRINITY_DN2083_c2_g1~~TRINITY_DN2083_c2_g1_i1.p1  ORF type:complete len:465 (-),score=250.66 TRINITY_DN2083_c2_g1_i1:84-1478(-)